MKIRTILGLAASALTLTVAAASAQQIQVSADLPDYTPVQGISGTLKSVGSDTMNNEMALWAEGFQKFYPNVRIEIEGKGSSTAPPALIAGTAQFGPMSREMKEAEIADFKKAFGYPPTQIATSIDMLAVYVHKDNPIKSLSFKDIDGIFSKTRASGADDVTTWGQLGLEGEWSGKPISPYGRNSASGTYGFFKEHAIAKGDFKDSVKEQPGSSAVVQAVASDKYGIGYSGIGYKTADVRAVPLAKSTTAKAIEATADNVYSGDYPLSRFLLLYVNAKPGSEMDPLRREFLRFVLSKQGQQIAAQDGYFPLTAALAAEQRKAIGLK